MFKQLFDLFLGTIFFYTVLVIAILVRITSIGPVLHKSDPVGRNSRRLRWFTDMCRVVRREVLAGLAK